MRRIFFGLAAGLLSLGALAFAAAPARADYHGHDRGHWEHRGHERWEHERREWWEHHRDWRPNYYYRYYGPRPYYYPYGSPGYYYRYYCP
jgi:hypothetical protein